MLERSCYPRSMEKKKRDSDVNVLAAQIVAEATGEAIKPIEKKLKEKNPHAQALGRLGGLKGGPARAKKLSAKKRKEVARKAAITRWSKR
jgi:hypothetical protein